MRAYGQWHLTLRSGRRDMDRILDFLNQRDPGAFERCKSRELFTSSDSAGHIWGKDMMHQDEEFYIELAHAVPKANWMVYANMDCCEDHTWLYAIYSEGTLSFDRLACANCELPVQYWDEVKYRLCNPDTGKTERTLLSSVPGEKWKDTYRDDWCPGEMRDLVFAFRGETKRFSSWEEAAAIVEKARGEVQEDSLDCVAYLVSNEEAPEGMDRQALRKNGIRLITEDQFIEGFAVAWVGHTIPLRKEPQM